MTVAPFLLNVILWFLFPMPFNPDEFIVARPVIRDIALVSPLDLHPDPLSEPITGRVDLDAVSLVLDRNNALKGIGLFRPGLLIPNQMEDLFLVGLEKIAAQVNDPARKRIVGSLTGRANDRTNLLVRQEIQRFLDRPVLVMINRSAPAANRPLLRSH